MLFIEKPIRRTTGTFCWWRLPWTFMIADTKRLGKAVIDERRGEFEGGKDKQEL
jgi:hypothetical protein